MNIPSFHFLLKGLELRMWRSDGGQVVGGGAEFWGAPGVLGLCQEGREAWVLCSGDLPKRREAGGEAARSGALAL